MMMKEYITPKQSGEAGAREIDLDGWDNEAFDTEPNNAE